MTIKEISHSAQAHLQTRTGSSFKRTHIYELLAAAFGFKSYAALVPVTVFTRPPLFISDFSPQISSIRRRCIELEDHAKSADVVAAELAAFLSKSGLKATNLPDLVADLLEDFLDEDTISPLLLDELKLVAAKENALAHYALALVCNNETKRYEDKYRGGDGSRWYAQEQQGQVLVGAQKEWADDYAGQLARSERYRLHLREAGRLGDWRALLDLAEHHGDVSFFNSRIDESLVDDPARVAEIAVNLGRKEDAHRWLTLAANAGDITAMRELIENYDHHDLQRCWTWAYLAESLGTDLTEDRHYAIHEDGSQYDDDVGGPAYVDGEDGVQLPPLEPEQDIAARQAAQQLYSQIIAAEKTLPSTSDTDFEE